MPIYLRKRDCGHAYTESLMALLIEENHVEVGKRRAQRSGNEGEGKLEGKEINSDNLSYFRIFLLTPLEIEPLILSFASKMHQICEQLLSV